MAEILEFMQPSRQPVRLLRCLPIQNVKDALRPKGPAVRRSEVAREQLVDCVEVEENVFLNSIALQNRGYAYIAP